MSEEQTSGGVGAGVVDVWAEVEAAFAAGEFRYVDLAEEMGQPYQRVRRWLRGEHRVTVDQARESYEALLRIRARRTRRSTAAG